MSTSQIKIDQFGRIADSGIHDATIQSFRFIMGDRFDVCLRDPAGGEKWLLLNEVVQIGFKNVVNGTIVSDVFCWRLSDPALLQEAMQNAWRVLLGGYYVEQGLQQLISDLIRRHASSLLVLFESSYGGSIAAICGDVKLSTLV
jgi:hypothetical protein